MRKMRVKRESALCKAGYQIRLSNTIAELGTKVKGGDVGDAVREFLNSDEVSTQCPIKIKVKICATTHTIYPPCMKSL